MTESPPAAALPPEPSSPPPQAAPTLPAAAIATTGATVAAAPSAGAAPATAPAVRAGWQPLDPAAARLSMLGGALLGLPVGVGAGIAAAVLLSPGWVAALALGLVLLAAAILAGALIARARTRRTRWCLDTVGLRVRSGLWWHSERLVPRRRVQHLDLERGPLERGAGLATLIVHTAGTRLHALRQSGFADADAVALRDALLPEKERDDDVL